MAIFGASWLDEPIDDDRPLFGRGLSDETHSEYFINSDGQYQPIKTKQELYDAIDNNNRFTFDGNDYHLK